MITTIAAITASLVIGLPLVVSLFMATLAAALPTSNYMTRNFFRLFAANITLCATAGKVDLFNGGFLNRKR